MTRCTLEVAASAERSLARLPEKVAAAVVELMLGPLLDNPRQVGAPLPDELAGACSARVGAYRILYEVIDSRQVVRVIALGHRADVYRPR